MEKGFTRFQAAGFVAGVLTVVVLVILYTFKAPEGRKAHRPGDFANDVERPGIATDTTPKPLPTTSIGKATTNAVEPLEIEQLLTAKAGHVSTSEASDFVRVLTSKAANFKPVFESLISSTNIKERLLGVFLSLESFGPSESVLSRAASDPSAFVSAEAAAWLYSKERFDEWDSYLKKSFAGLSSEQIVTVLANLNNRPARLELPAAMSLLGLGRGLEDYVTEMFRRNAAAVSTAGELLASANFSEIQKENTLKLLGEANPPQYVAILREIVSASEDNRPLRWQAIWNFGQTAADAASETFISDWLEQHPQDALRAKLEEASASIKTRLNSPVSIFTALEQRLGQASPGNVTPTAESMNLFAHYVRLSIRDGHRVDDSLLTAYRTELARHQLTDYTIRRRLSDVDYLIWRTRQ